MSIWGHQTVIVEKDVAKRVWHVMTTKGAHLVDVPWADAFKEFPHAPDYAEAVATCQAHSKTRLTASEEAKALYTETGEEPEVPENAPNVVAVDFKRKRRK